MDEFLKDIHTLIYKEWILKKTYQHCQIYLEDEETVIIETKYGKAQVIFYKLNIIELCVINKLDNKTLFFLHFQMNNMKHAVNLFEEMIDTLLTLVNKPKVKLLLCCSGGLTSSYFSQKLQHAVEFFKLDYEVFAIGYHDLMNIGENYDVIMLAPQVSYMYSQVRYAFKDKIIFNIPSRIFAGYDVKGLIEVIENQLKQKKDKQKDTVYKTIDHLESQQYYLCISLFRNSGRVHIGYRIYQGKVMLVDKETIKNVITMQDIYDVIDTSILNYPDITTIGFAAPGIINDGYACYANINGFYEMNYKKLLSRYSQKIIITNDVNTAVIGYHAMHIQYSSQVLLFQPVKSYAGAGIMINHQLVAGKHNVAGEMQYLPESGDNFEAYHSFETILEEIEKIVLSLISVIGPELIVIYCTVLPDVIGLETSLKKKVPQAYIPKLKKIDDIQEYIFLGQMILCN